MDANSERVDPPQPQRPKLLDRLRATALDRGINAAIADDFVAWGQRYIRFHGMRHPRELAAPEVGQFLAEVVRSEPDPLPALERARHALDFLYRDWLCIDFGDIALPKPPRLLDRMRQVLRVRNYSPRTEDCYVQWAERYIRFHGLRHPAEMGTAEVERFLTDLAVNGRVSASTQNQALNALLFLYGQVLELDIGRLDAVRARRGKRLLVVRSAEEVRRVLDHIAGADGVFRLMAQLLYGSGLRLMECCRLRVHDIDRGRGQIVVRGGKGDKDRVVMLPRSAHVGLDAQLDRRRELHVRDVRRGVVRFELSCALERKYPAAPSASEWQFALASRQLSRCRRTGRRLRLIDASQRNSGAGRIRLNRPWHGKTFGYKAIGRMLRMIPAEWDGSGVGWRGRPGTNARAAARLSHRSAGREPGYGAADSSSSSRK